MVSLVWIRMCVKNMLLRQEMDGILETNNPTKDQIRNYRKMRKRIG